MKAATSIFQGVWDERLLVSCPHCYGSLVRRHQWREPAANDYERQSIIRCADCGHIYGEERPD